MLVAVVNHRYEHYQEDSLLPEMTVGVVSCSAVAPCSFWCLPASCQLSVLISGYSYAQVSHLYVSRYLASERLAEIEEALWTSMRFDPLEGRYPFELGRVEIVRQRAQEAFDYSLQAARLQPMSGPYLQRLAMMLPEPRQSRSRTGLMEEGYRRALNKDGLLGGWVEWLLITGKREQAIEGAAGSVSHRIQDCSLQMIPLLATYEFSRNEVIDSSCPGRCRAGYVTASISRKPVISRVLAISGPGRSNSWTGRAKLRPGWFTQLISYYRRQKQPEKALEVIRLGVEKLPDYAPFRIWLGDHYRQQGITYRAREEYERAVMLEPGNDSYRKKLKKLELDIEFGN